MELCAPAHPLISGQLQGREGRGRKGEGEHELLVKPLLHALASTPLQGHKILSPCTGPAPPCANSPAAPSLAAPVFVDPEILLSAL